MSTGFAVSTSRPVPIPAPGAISARSWPICCGIMLPMPIRSGALPRLPVPGRSIRLPRWLYASGPSRCCGVAANGFHGSPKHGMILWRCWPMMPLPVSPAGSGEVGACCPAVTGHNIPCRQRSGEFVFPREDRLSPSCPSALGAMGSVCPVRPANPLRCRPVPACGLHVGAWSGAGPFCAGVRPRG